MPTEADLTRQIDSAAHDVACSYDLLGILSASVRASANGPMIVCPAGRSAAVAMLLYAAADKIADQAPKPPAIRTR